MSAPQLSIRDVTKQFGAHVAVEGVSLDVAAGDVAVIVGPSGCGKTTLLRLIAGLEMPDAGQVWLAGRQVAAARRSLVPPHERKIGFVFQDLALWPHLTVEQNLDFVLQSAATARNHRRSRIQEMLATVRVEALAGRYPHELSGGEQQRVALARAFVGHPQLLVMDEPLSSVDPELRAVLRVELLRLQQASALTMVYVTHDREDAAVLADCVIEMRNGRIVASNTTSRNEDRG
jgi:ABC-type Fe3+/spermidine/putrescine transport system ATPase subunit